MTREEAIELKAAVGRLMYSNNKDVRDYNALIDFIESAVRPVSREQLEKVWGGEWEEERFAGEHEGWQHRECGRHSTEKTKWCPKCGKAMTDEAVDMVMERMRNIWTNE